MSMSNVNTIRKYLQEIQIFDNIRYIDGDPYGYINEFSNLWIEHMKYLQTIESFPYNIEFNEQVFNESLRKFRQKHKYIKLFMARENRRMIGFLQAGIATSGTYGFLSDLHVRRGYRGKNIGRNLVENCLTWFNKNNVREIGIEVVGGNENVLEFYKKFGFDVEMYRLKRVL